MLEGVDGIIDQVGKWVDRLIAVLATDCLKLTHDLSPPTELHVSKS